MARSSPGSSQRPALSARCSSCVSCGGAMIDRRVTICSRASQISPDAADQPSTPCTPGTSSSAAWISPTRYSWRKSRVRSPIKCWINWLTTPLSESWMLKTAIKTAPAMVRVNRVSSRRPFLRKVLRTATSTGRETRPAHCTPRPANPRPAKRSLGRSLLIACCTLMRAPWWTGTYPAASGSSQAISACIATAPGMKRKPCSAAPLVVAR